MNLLHATHCIIKEWGEKNGEPGTKISLDDSKKREQQ